MPMLPLLGCRIMRGPALPSAVLVPWAVGGPGRLMVSLFLSQVGCCMARWCCREQT